jgi:hypothetical protein
MHMRHTHHSIPTHATHTPKTHISDTRLKHMPRTPHTHAHTPQTATQANAPPPHEVDQYLVAPVLRLALPTGGPQCPVAAAGVHPWRSSHAGQRDSSVLPPYVRMSHWGIRTRDRHARKGGRGRYFHGAHTRDDVSAVGGSSSSRRPGLHGP